MAVFASFEKHKPFLPNLLNVCEFYLDFTTNFRKLFGWAVFVIISGNMHKELLKNK